MDPKHYKIYRYVDLLHNGLLEGDKFDLPLDINFKTGLKTRLHPKTYMIQGELQKVEYYSSITLDSNGTQVFSDLILKEEYVYIRTATHFAIYRDQIVTWYTEDDEPGDTKVMRKYYDNQQSIVEGKRRRENIVENLTMMTLGLLIATETGEDQETLILWGRDFMEAHKIELDNFILSANTAIITGITNDAVFTWLDNVIDGNGTTIKQYIIASLTI